jgi:hypothetical protein
VALDQPGELTIVLLALVTAFALGGATLIRRRFLSAS